MPEVEPCQAAVGNALGRTRQESGERGLARAGGSDAEDMANPFDISREMERLSGYAAAYQWRRGLRGEHVTVDVGRALPILRGRHPRS
jgi:hypothetical protein